MVRGCEKRMVRLKNPEGGMFEEVLFVLRDEAELCRCHSRDIVAEATRLLEEAVSCREGKRGARVSPLPFLLGVLTATAILVPFLLL